MPAIATSSSRDTSGARPPRTPAIDTIRLVETPEGCQLTLRIAGPLARARAWLVDLAIRMFLYMAGASALSTFGSMGTGLILILVFLLEWAYPVVFEIWRDGQTPGKRMCHLAVVHADGTPVGTSAAIVRNIVRAVDFLPVGYVVGLITMLCAGSGRRLGDLAAGTVVVHTAARVDHRRTARRAGPGAAHVDRRCGRPPASAAVGRRTARRRGLRHATAPPVARARRGTRPHRHAAGGRRRRG